LNRAKSFICNEDGAELVEYSFAAMVLFALIFGIIEFAWVIYAGNFMAVAAQQGSRYAMVRGSDWASSCVSVSDYGCKATAADVQNYILSLAHGGINLQKSDITVTWLTTTAAGSSCTQYSQGCQVEVKVSYSFPLHIPFLSTTIPLSSTSIETIQN